MGHLEQGETAQMVPLLPYTSRVCVLSALSRTEEAGEVLDDQLGKNPVQRVLAPANLYLLPGVAKAEHVAAVIIRDTSSNDQGNDLNPLLAGPLDLVLHELT